MKKYITTVAIGISVGLGATAWLVSQEGRPRTGPAAADREAVQKALLEIVGGSGDVKPLVVTYDDVHGLHGGLRLTINGSGKVEQRAVRVKAGEPRDVTQEELMKLVALLVKHEAWQQKVPDRPAKPDESRARLTVAYGGKSVQIWEWYNDLKKNQRIDLIREYMQSIAWKAPPR